MNVNINNYSLSYLTDTKYELDQNIPFTERHGCNGFVKVNNSKYIYIVIPKANIDEVLTCINNTTGINYTLDNILDVYSEMSFKYTYKLIENEIVFNGSRKKDYYIFEIENTIHRLHRYYAFCMIRHFYYAQDILTMYMTLYNDLSDDMDKIIALSGFTCIQNQYSFIGGKIPLEKNLTFLSILETYKKQGSNQLTLGAYTSLTWQDIGNKDSALQIIRKTRTVLENYKQDIIFADEFSRKAFKTYIIDSSKQLLEEHFNIDPKQLKLFKSSYTSYKDNGVSISVKGIRAPHNLLIPNIPSILNMTNTVKPKRFAYLIPRIPKIVININKVSRTVYDCVVLNSGKIINSLKNRRLVLTLSDQVEATTYPFKLVRSMRTRNDEVIIINNSTELKDYNLKKYIKQPLLKDSKKHYLFFTKKGLFLYQIDLGYVVMDSDNPDIANYTLKDSDIIEKCTKVFDNSGLDIGVVICDVSLEDNSYYVEDITPYVHNGEFSKNMYLNEINKIICVD